MKYAPFLRKQILGLIIPEQEVQRIPRLPFEVYITLRKPIALVLSPRC